MTEHVHAPKPTLGQRPDPLRGASLADALEPTEFVSTVEAGAGRELADLVFAWFAANRDLLANEFEWRSRGLVAFDALLEAARHLGEV